VAPAGKSVQSFKRPQAKGREYICAMVLAQYIGAVAMMAFTAADFAGRSRTSAASRTPAAVAAGQVGEQMRDMPRGAFFDVAPDGCERWRMSAAHAAPADCPFVACRIRTRRRRGSRRSRCPSRFGPTRAIDELEDRAVVKARRWSAAVISNMAVVDQTPRRGTSRRRTRGIGPRARAPSASQPCRVGNG